MPHAVCSDMGGWLNECKDGGIDAKEASEICSLRIHNLPQHTNPHINWPLFSLRCQWTERGCACLVYLSASPQAH